MDKCFCHFNGFRVKDAEARQMIENLSSIKETNNGLPISFWVGSREQYEAIDQPAENCLYIITDDTSADDLQQLLNGIIENITAADEKAQAADEKAQAAMEKALSAQDAAADVLFGVAPRIIRDEVGALSWSPATGTGLDLDFLEAEVVGAHRFRSLNMVFLSVQLTIKGSMEAGETVKFVQTGKYKPKYEIASGFDAALRFPLVQSGLYNQFPIAGSIASDGVYFTAINDLTVYNNTTFQFSGWYMYDPAAEEEG